MSNRAHVSKFAEIAAPHKGEFVVPAPGIRHNALMLVQMANPGFAVTMTILFSLLFIGTGFGMFARRMNRDDGFSRFTAFMLGLCLGPIGLYLIHQHNKVAAAETRRKLERVRAEHEAREIPDNAAGPFEQPRAPEFTGPEVIVRDTPPKPEELRSAPAFAPPPAPGSKPPVEAAQHLEIADREALVVQEHQVAAEEKRWAASPFKKEKA